MTKKTTKTTKRITLEIGNDKLRFEAEAKNYQRFIDEVSGDKKSVPMQRLLQRTIVSEDKEKLAQYIDFHFATMAGLLIEQLTGDVEVTIKK